jgi:hypothetical protein
MRAGFVERPHADEKDTAAHATGAGGSEFSGAGMKPVRPTSELHGASAPCCPAAV